MTHEDRGHYAGKHSPDRRPDPEIARRVEEKARGGAISCAAAHGLARSMGVAPSEIGFTADALEIRLVKCQLGLYGYAPRKRIVEPAEHVPPALERAIRSQLTEGRLRCEDAWAVARRFKVAKMRVASACETLNIKIISCQLGAF